VWSGVLYAGDVGTASRTVASTNMNATSSRAHTVVTITFDQFIKTNKSESKKTSIINLVDLAGISIDRWRITAVQFSSVQMRILISRFLQPFAAWKNNNNAILSLFLYSIVGEWSWTFNGKECQLLVQQRESCEDHITCSSWQDYWRSRKTAEHRWRRLGMDKTSLQSWRRYDMIMHNVRLKTGG